MENSPEQTQEEQVVATLREGYGDEGFDLLQLGAHEVQLETEIAEEEIS